MNVHSQVVSRTISLVLLILGWQLLAWWIDDFEILPSPLDVVGLSAELWQLGLLPIHLVATIERVFLAFVFAMTIGSVLGYLMGRFTVVNQWLDAWLLVFLNLPALVLIVLCYLWIGLNEIAAILAVTLNKVPLVTTLIREGARCSSSQLRDLAKVYKLSFWQRLRHIILPELYPHSVAAARAGLSVIWKIVLVVEFLGRSDGIGRQIHTQFSLFNINGVLAYALSFVVFILLVEFLVLQPLERRVNRWKTDAL